MSFTNPLLDLTAEPYGAFRFSEIRPEHFDEAFPVWMKRTRERIEKIESQDDVPGWDNTMEPLAYASLELDRLRSLLSNLNSAATTPDIQALAEKWMPELSVFFNGIYQRPALFARIRKLYEQRETLGLDEEQKMLLETYYRSFVHNGALLDEAGKARLKEIKSELSRLSLQFQKNLLHDTGAYTLHLTHKAEVEGLPADVLERAAARAEAAGKEGWLFGLDFPSYGPFMRFAVRRDLREKLYRAYMSRAYHGDRYDNCETVRREAALRKQYAALLGYPSYAHLVLEERMAETPEKVMNFLDELYGYARPYGLAEFARLQKLAAGDGIDRLQAWDTAFYSERLKARELHLTDEAVRPYFPLEATVQGMFDVATKLYGLRFEPAPGVDVYHPDVKAYRILEADGRFTALLYMDFYARDNKRQGAWMTVYKPQYRKDGENERPHVSIVTNFARPTENRPVLLNFYEVNTLFHEFGHALHGMLADTRYPELSGTNVYWDFVELPSQIMENWTYESEVLRMFARHYRTGEMIPDALVEKLGRTRRFLEGMQTLRQLGFGYLDMAWHYKLEKTPEDLEAFEHKVFEPVRLTPPVKGAVMSTQFGHLFAGGYAAGYYAYKWAELLDADAFSIFKKNAIFDRETAHKFRRLLEQGGSKHPMKLYQEFAGRPPHIEALLQRAGFTEPER